MNRASHQRPSCFTPSTAITFTAPELSLIQTAFDGCKKGAWAVFSEGDMKGLFALLSLPFDTVEVSNAFRKGVAEPKLGRVYHNGHPALRMQEKALLKFLQQQKELLLQGVFAASPRGSAGHDSDSEERAVTPENMTDICAALDGSHSTTDAVLREHGFTPGTAWFALCRKYFFMDARKMRISKAYHCYLALGGGMLKGGDNTTYSSADKTSRLKIDVLLRTLMAVFPDDTFACDYIMEKVAFEVRGADYISFSGFTTVVDSLYSAAKGVQLLRRVLRVVVHRGFAEDAGRLFELLGAVTDYAGRALLDIPERILREGDIVPSPQGRKRGLHLVTTASPRAALLSNLDGDYTAVTLRDNMLASGTPEAFMLALQTRCCVSSGGAVTAAQFASLLYEACVVIAPQENEVRGVLPFSGNLSRLDVCFKGGGGGGDGDGGGWNALHSQASFACNTPSSPRNRLLQITEQAALAAGFFVSEPRPRQSQSHVPDSQVPSEDVSAVHSDDDSVVLLPRPPSMAKPQSFKGVPTHTPPRRRRAKLRSVYPTTRRAEELPLHVRPHAHAVYLPVVDSTVEQAQRECRKQWSPPCGPPPGPLLVDKNLVPLRHPRVGAKGGVATVPVVAPHCGYDVYSWGHQSAETSRMRDSTALLSKTYAKGRVRGRRASAHSPQSTEVSFVGPPPPSSLTLALTYLSELDERASLESLKKAGKEAQEALPPMVHKRRVRPASVGAKVTSLIAVSKFSSLLNRTLNVEIMKKVQKQQVVVVPALLGVAAGVVWQMHCESNAAATMQRFARCTAARFELAQRQRDIARYHRALQMITKNEVLDDWFFAMKRYKQNLKRVRECVEVMAQQRVEEVSVECLQRLGRAMLMRQGVAEWYRSVLRKRELLRQQEEKARRREAMGVLGKFFKVITARMAVRQKQRHLLMLRACEQRMDRFSVIIQQCARKRVAVTKATRLHRSCPLLSVVQRKMDHWRRNSRDVSKLLKPPLNSF